MASGGYMKSIRRYLRYKVFFGRYPGLVPAGSIVFFPLSVTLMGCGIAGMVAIRRREDGIGQQVDLDPIQEKVAGMQALGYEGCRERQVALDDTHYLGGKGAIETLYGSVRDLSRNEPLYRIFTDTGLRESLRALSDRIQAVADTEARLLSEHMGHLTTGQVDVMAGRIDRLRDTAWCLSAEILSNADKISGLMADTPKAPSMESVTIYKRINGVLNSIDRLEVRGRDSAGISLLFSLTRPDDEAFTKALLRENLKDQFDRRCDQPVLINGSINRRLYSADSREMRTSLVFTYKVAAEIGRLGDNVRFLRKQIREDPVFQLLVSFSPRCHSIASHTRWASIGAISEANCHPVDNRIIETGAGDRGIIHVCLNGDIDNYLQLKSQVESNGCRIPDEVTTDTKIIPLQIQKYLNRGRTIEEAFRLSVNDFDGSHAIMMQTDLAPDRLFLAQKGSGQAIFIGLAADHYMPSSEVYGFVEETDRYIKLDGEKTVEGINGPTQGQVFVIGGGTTGGIDGMAAWYYDGTPLQVAEPDINHTQITSRDIDRQDFDHYFLKEIFESPQSVEKTIQNRWKINENGHYTIQLDERVFPGKLKSALSENRIRRIYFVGQGTAGVAALAGSDILNYYLNEPSVQVSALKSSELSGFKLGDRGQDSMADCLVIFISQSGTTTDTNRTADMVRERGAHTIAIVNRRDSDITFKVDGVMYTSTGRDIEMSVASTKAFYSQIVAGALLSLNIAALKGRRKQGFISEEVSRLLALPAKMRTILGMSEKIQASAAVHAVGHTYWAAVGSGPNKASADEIRIKLSELCYKTISSDYVEDKKHIDLSSEPLIIVCAAGTRNTVIGDIVKDTAIFQAHKATPIVIASEGEERFAPYAADVFHVPAVSEHLSPIVNTLVGHLWGYYAALAINDGSAFLDGFRKDLQADLENYARQGLSIYEVVLEKSFREKIARFYNDFQRKKTRGHLPTILGHRPVSDLILLFKYLSGKLPVSDFEIDFNVKGTASNMINCLFACVADAINMMIRPVDAIKHQAKTVTVGTSRISDAVEGILFDALSAHGFSVSQLVVSNVLVLKNLQGIVSRVEGAIRYKIGSLNLLGEPTADTTIEVLKKQGSLAPLPSRVETDHQLKGTKRIIVRDGNVYIGRGKKDDRHIIIVPVISTSPDTPNLIEYLLLLHISFKQNVPLDAKIKALGGKYEHIIYIVQENSVSWRDDYLELIPVEELFGRSAEKIGETIISILNHGESS